MAFEDPIPRRTSDRGLGILGFIGGIALIALLAAVLLYPRDSTVVGPTTSMSDRPVATGPISPGPTVKVPPPDVATPPINPN